MIFVWKLFSRAIWKRHRWHWNNCSRSIRMRKKVSHHVDLNSPQPSPAPTHEFSFFFLSSWIHSPCKLLNILGYTLTHHNQSIYQSVLTSRYHITAVNSLTVRAVTESIRLSNCSTLVASHSDSVTKMLQVRNTRFKIQQFPAEDLRNASSVGTRTCIVFFVDVLGIKPTRSGVNVRPSLQESLDLYDLISQIHFPVKPILIFYNRDDFSFPMVGPLSANEARKVREAPWAVRPRDHPLKSCTLTSTNAEAWSLTHEDVRNGIWKEILYDASKSF